MFNFWEELVNAYVVMFFVLLMGLLLLGPIVLMAVLESAWFALAYFITLPLAFVVFSFLDDYYF